MSTINVEIVPGAGVFDAMSAIRTLVAETVECLSFGKQARSGAAAAMDRQDRRGGHPPPEFSGAMVLCLNLTTAQVARGIHRIGFGT
ncbi:hypothetical protein C7T36_14700 [Rhodococcus sp. AD45-ID]|nr:hypothetical protein C7T36_14700 [Rhodococcus sp. AD45-ID]